MEESVQYLAYQIQRGGGMITLSGHPRLLLPPIDLSGSSILASSSFELLWYSLTVAAVINGANPNPGRRPAQIHFE